MKNNYKINSFENDEALSDALCERIVSDLSAGIEKNGRAYLAVSGGNTPKKVFEKLSKSDLFWTKVIVTLVDERWVKPNDLKSNEKLVKEHLLQNKARTALFIPLKNVEITAKDGEKITRNRLKSIKNFDVVILGMGDDAHTASFFPHPKSTSSLALTAHAKELDTAFNTQEFCCATTATVEPLERMTLSRGFLLSTKNLILHIEGKKKKEVFDLACASDDMYEKPIISMMQQEKPILEVYYA
jgi:6-phosphogluconolactonase